MSETELPQSRRTRRIWGIVFVVQSVLLALALIALARGTPDTYLNQHARQAALAVCGLGLALLFLFRRPALQAIAMVGVIAAIIWHISLTIG